MEFELQQQLPQQLPQQLLGCRAVMPPEQVPDLVALTHRPLQAVEVLLQLVGRLKGRAAVEQTFALAYLPSMYLMVAW